MNDHTKQSAGQPSAPNGHAVPTGSTAPELAGHDTHAGHETAEALATDPTRTTDPTHATPAADQPATTDAADATPTTSSTRSPVAPTCEELRRALFTSAEEFILRELVATQPCEPWEVNAATCLPDAEFYPTWSNLIERGLIVEGDDGFEVGADWVEGEVASRPDSWRDRELGRAMVEVEVKAGTGAGVGGDSVPT
jgi:hypothetical protein